MDESARRLLMVVGSALALIGAFLVAAAYGAIHRPYTPPPGCEVSACPSHPEFGFFSAEDIRLVGFALVFSGVVLALAAAAIRIEAPVSRAEEELLIERIERTSRRLD